MAKKLHQLSLRDLLVVALPLFLAIGLAFYGASRFIKPAPPDRLVLSSGGDSGAYRIFAARYHDVLARYGIELVIESSAGSAENLERLRDPDSTVDIGFLQGGSARPLAEETLRGLGELYYEPLWVFYRADLEADGKPLDQLAQLRGRRIAIGADGSGTQLLARELLASNKVGAGTTHLIEAGGLPVVEQLRRGQLDAVMTVGPTESAVVWSLLYAPGVRLMSLTHAEAYTRRLPYLSHLTLPRGTVDMARDIPPHDVSLLATRATLLAREGTHPALLDLMMQAVSEVHAGSGMFQKAGEFPRSGHGDQSDFPLSDEARRFYTSGKPWLQRYLPFWAATLVDRMLVMLLPFIAVLIPLIRLAPSLYGWRVKSRIYRRYGELKFLEAEFAEQPERCSPEQWQQRLDAIEAEVNRLRAPLPFSDMLYTLRAHIALVRAELRRRYAMIAGDSDCSKLVQ